MNFDEAKMAYIMECRKVGKLPETVTTMIWDRISEQYTLSNKDGDVADAGRVAFVGGRCVASDADLAGLQAGAAVSVR